MADEKFSFEQARVRLEEIASEARKKDTSLERSLDLLEEGVRLANICTELVDHADLSASGASGQDDENGAADGLDAGSPEPEEPSVDGRPVSSEEDAPEAETPAPGRDAGVAGA
ncbi:MAG: exodeoxyribonuclease VII small subunit [Aeromicrobium sp.]|nr:exodeoxyribonuclease VII small subunit [Aeromicrobium sp.]